MKTQNLVNEGIPTLVSISIFGIFNQAKLELKHAGTKINAFGNGLAGRANIFLLTGELKLRIAETRTLIAAVKVFPFATVLLSEYVLTVMMAHPVILPSPVGLDIGTAISKAIKRIRLCMTSSAVNAVGS